MLFSDRPDDDDDDDDDDGESLWNGVCAMADEQSQRPGGQRGPISDIERFLMEVERLRRRSTEEKRAAESSEAIDEVEVVRPAVRRVPTPTPQRKVVRPRVRRQEGSERQTVLEVVPARPAPSEPAPPAAVTNAEPQVSVIRRTTQTSQTIDGVLAMLKTMRQLRASILVSEILGPPVCRRHGFGRRL